LKKAKSCNNTTESQCLVEIGVKKRCSTFWATWWKPRG